MKPVEPGTRWAVRMPDGLWSKHESPDSGTTSSRHDCKHFTDIDAALACLHEWRSTERFSEAGDEKPRNAYRLVRLPPPRAKCGEHRRRIAQLEAEVQQVSQMAAGAIERAQGYDQVFLLVAGSQKDPMANHSTPWAYLRARFIELDAEVKRLRAQIPPREVRCVKCDVPSYAARLLADGCINKSSHEFPVVTQNTENDHGRP